MNSFDTLSSLLWTSIKDALQALGFTKPTEIQAKIIPILLENYNQDVHAQAQTGTGKTLAFGIPLLQAMDASDRRVQGLVIAPTRELVLQIYESLKDVSRGSNITIDTIYGGMPITRQIESLKRGVHIIVGTPGRLNDLLRRGALQLDHLKVLVLDEADIMLDTRRGVDRVSSHNGNHIEAVPIEETSLILTYVEQHNVQVIGIDEVQFFPHAIIPVICALVDSGKRVLLAGLDLDFRGIPFGPIPVLLAIADHITKLQAICTQCGKDAHHTQRLVNHEPARFDDPIIQVGAQEAYQARCRNCYSIDKKPNFYEHNDQ